MVTVLAAEGSRPLEPPDPSVPARAGGPATPGGLPALQAELALRWLGALTVLALAGLVDGGPPAWLVAAVLAALTTNTLLLLRRDTRGRRATGVVDLGYVAALALAAEDPAVRLTAIGVAAFWVLQAPRDALALCAGLGVLDVGIALADGADVAAAVLAVAALWSAVVTTGAARVRETRASAEATLRRARARVADDLLEAEARTRLGLAAELHDGPLQLLLAARQDLAESADPAAVRAGELIARSTEELRALVQGLEPTLSAAHTAAQLRDWFTVLAARYRFAGAVDVDPGLGEVHPLAASAARELLSNAARHARADRIHVRIVSGAGGVQTVTVEDDGIGFDPASGAGIGLTLLRRRVADAGGRIAIAAGAGARGTRAEVVLPPAPAAG